MKTEYKYIHFVKIEDKPKTSVWSCRNIKSGGVLGEVRWYPHWRSYCYFPGFSAVYSSECLQAIQDFIFELEKWHRLRTTGATLADVFSKESEGDSL